MRAGIKINPEITAADLRKRSRQETNGRVVARMLAIANVMDGMKREDAAKQAGMSRSRLHIWIARYNESGIDGLRDNPKGHPPRRLTAEQEQEVKELVIKGPDGVLVRWRCIDLKEEILKRFNIDYHENSISRILHRLGFSHVSVRPLHPKANLEAQEDFKKNFPSAVKKIISEHAQNRPIELWFQDEARVGQRGTLTRIWAQRGTRPRMQRDQRRASVYIFGAVCPSRDVGAALVLPKANTEAMNLHLKEISNAVQPQAHAIVIVDGAGWHKSKDLDVPQNLTLMPIPPYSPELNAQENIWQYLRQNHLAGRVFNTADEIVDACCDAWKSLVDGVGNIRAIASRSWFQCPVS